MPKSAACGASVSSNQSLSTTLVIGGSGMLAKASLWLAGQGKTIVLGRSRRKLDALAELAPAGAIVPLSLDYTSTDTLARHLASASDMHGPITRTVAWIHNDGLDAHRVIAEAIDEDADYFHLLGSAAADPRAGVEERFAHLRAQFGSRYREIVLGFQLEGNHSRWLTHEEIATGVIDAISNPRPRSIIGVVEPWSRRP